MIYSSFVCHIENIVNLYIHFHKTCRGKKCELLKIIKTFHYCTADQDYQEDFARRHYDQSKMVNFIHFLLKVFIVKKVLLLTQIGKQEF